MVLSLAVIHASIMDVCCVIFNKVWDEWVSQTIDLTYLLYWCTLGTVRVTLAYSKNYNLNFRQTLVTATINIVSVDTPFSSFLLLHHPCAGIQPGSIYHLFAEIKTKTKLEAARRVHISAKWTVSGWRWVEVGARLHEGDALWEGHTLLKTGLSAHRQTKVKTVYLPDYTKLATIGHNYRPTVIETLDLLAYIYCYELNCPSDDSSHKWRH